VTTKSSEFTTLVVDHSRFRYPGLNSVVVTAHYRDPKREPMVLCAGEDISAAHWMALEILKKRGFYRYDDMPENFRAPYFPKTPQGVYSKKGDPYIYLFLSYAVIPYAETSEVDFD
jgi:hypothetical protein